MHGEALNRRQLEFLAQLVAVRCTRTSGPTNLPRASGSSFVSWPEEAEIKKRTRGYTFLFRNSYKQLDVVIITTSR